MVINKYGADAPESRALLIIDDCNDDPKMLNRPMMQHQQQQLQPGLVLCYLKRLLLRLRILVV